jgi:hypothetical protein
LKLPAALDAGIGISQAITDPAVCASAGRIVTTVDAAAAPSTSTDLRLGLKPPSSPALSSTSLMSPHLCAASFIRVKPRDFERSEEEGRPAAGFGRRRLFREDRTEKNRFGHVKGAVGDRRRREKNHIGHV